MPRKAREKTKEAIFHIMARSISEVDLFKGKDDKLSISHLLRNIKRYISSEYTATVLWLCRLGIKQ